MTHELDPAMSSWLNDFGAPLPFNTTYYETEYMCVLLMAFIGTRDNVTKLFLSTIYTFSLKVRVFVPGKFLEPCLMFVGKARSLP
jgi:hypothetical protein